MANRSVDIDKKDVKRVTVSFPQDSYIYLERIAQEKKVSLSWIVREAVENYMEASNK
ncbi:MAG: ribbon-helix-helix protein, CopG family [Candidatus Delongbacteria bacterium]|nr:ribbon-helix-helix protein, CopG family [Candidatus Delongbacteria bacterium]